MRGGKRNSAGLSALTDRTQRRPVINCRHVAIKVKRFAQIKPAYLGDVTEESVVAASLCRGAVKDLVEARRQSAVPTANSLCPSCPSWLISADFDHV